MSEAAQVYVVLILALKLRDKNHTVFCCLITANHFIVPISLDRGNCIYRYSAKLVGRKGVLNKK